MQRPSVHDARRVLPTGCCLSLLHTVERLRWKANYPMAPEEGRPSLPFLLQHPQHQPSWPSFARDAPPVIGSIENHPLVQTTHMLDEQKYRFALSSDVSTYVPYTGRRPKEIRGQGSNRFERTYLRWFRIDVGGEFYLGKGSSGRRWKFFFFSD